MQSCPVLFWGVQQVQFSKITQYIEMSLDYDTGVRAIGGDLAAFA